MIHDAKRNVNLFHQNRLTLFAYPRKSRIRFGFDMLPHTDYLRPAPPPRKELPPLPREKPPPREPLLRPPPEENPPPREPEEKPPKLLPLGIVGLGGGALGRGEEKGLGGGFGRGGAEGLLT